MSQKRRGFGLLIIALVALGVVGGTVAFHFATRIYHFEAGEEGVLYRSGLLEPAELERAIEAYGIRTVVSLIDLGSEREAVAEEARIVEARGLRFVELAMEVETPPTPAQLATWLDLLADPERHPVLVHCKHGVVRTGMLVAAYQIEAGATDNEAVLRALPMFGHDLDAPYRKPMRDFVRGYRPTGRLVVGSADR